MGSLHDYLERCDKLAVMGGTFDPIHNGHLAAAEAVLHEYRPRRVLFVPGGQPPHKPDKPVTAGGHRYQMVLAAVCENPGFDVSPMEIGRPGPSYTVDTVAALRGICPPGSEIYFIVGADALLEILSWKDAPRLLRLCRFIAVPRPGSEMNLGFIARLRETYGAEIHTLEGPLLDISGTALRERFAAGQPVSGLMPPAAEDYARLHGLYESEPKRAFGAKPEARPQPKQPHGAEGAGLTPARFGQVKSRLEERLSPRRFLHTLGVVEESEKLARRYGADVNKARWAALLHDCAKEYGAAKKRALCERWGIPLDEFSSADIDITHSLLSAESARRDYLVTDRDVLQAIRCHTLGQKGMTLLDKIIMLADYIEPRREAYPPLAEMRRLARTDINGALAAGMEYTNRELEAGGRSVHPRSLEALKELK